MSEHKLPYYDYLVPYVEFDTIYTCHLCKNKGGFGYRFKECYFRAHKECIDLALNSPLCEHRLKIYAPGSLDYADENCHFCRNPFSKVFFHCSICNFSIDKRCLKHPPPLTIHNPKCHKHELALLSRVLTFICNACGLRGDRNPYVCLQCNLTFHKDCMYLPQVISINRHDHRISRISHLGCGDWDCGVCRQKIDWVYGAFSCSRCRGYAVHSKCATRKDVWDGKELEDEPEEEDPEDPFKVINEKEIVHFSHEKHNLRLAEDYVTKNDNTRCNGCVLPINDDLFYKCIECDFCLHKTCANLPRKKRHMLHNHQLTLRVDYTMEDDDLVFECSACEATSNGFRYVCYEKGSYCDVSFDVRCCSISEPFHHELHPHVLYYVSTYNKRCAGCGALRSPALSCTVCEYSLGVECATLPRKVKHRYDDHFLSLCQGAGNASGDLWCDICETKTDPSVWYYTCDECGVTLHIDCVLGDLYYLKRGPIFSDLEIIPNNGVSRPICSKCNRHCRFPSLFKRTTENSIVFACSLARCL